MPYCHRKDFSFANYASYFELYAWLAKNVSRKNRVNILILMCDSNDKMTELMWQKLCRCVNWLRMSVKWTCASPDTRPKILKSTKKANHSANITIKFDISNVLSSRNISQKRYSLFCIDLLFFRQMQRFFYIYYYNQCMNENANQLTNNQAIADIMYNLYVIVLLYV